ncbi:MAG: tetratricopeptide repeat protein, partial [Lutibacter sp.]
MKKIVKMSNKLNKMRKQLVLLSLFLMSMTVFGQKNELKTAEKAIKANNFPAALAAVNQAEGLIANADQKTKAKFYYLKGMALYQNGANSANLTKVGAAFNKLISFEKETNKYKYTNEVAKIINSMVTKLATNAQADYNKGLETKSDDDFARAADGFNAVYALSPRDTSYLDNAALVYFYAKKYDKSIAAYNKLLDLNYTGIATVFAATDKKTGKQITYQDKKSRDLQVKLGLAENPTKVVKESRRESIFKNLEGNYTAKKMYDKALEILGNGRKEFPKSYSLLIDEANVYYYKGDDAMFKNRLEEAIKMNPTEPSLYYNVGVMNMNQGKTEEAITNFKKAIDLKPDYADAYNNLGAALIDKTKPIIEEMNKSLSDFDKYDKLQAKQMAIYKEALPYYEKAYELNKNNISTVQTLRGLY